MKIYRVWAVTPKKRSLIAQVWLKREVDSAKKDWQKYHPRSKATLEVEEVEM